jgi:hypothetical protein
MNFDSMKKEYIYKVLKGMPANIFMLLLAVANYAVYVNQPDVWPFDYNSYYDLVNIVVFIFLLPCLIIVFAGIFALVKSLYNILIGKEVHIVTLIVTYCALFSLLLASYGTFFKGNVNDFKRKLKWEKSLIIKSYGGEINNDKYSYIWRNDTIMYRYFVKREGLDTKREWFLDTMLIDAANESCYWTHSPELKYDIIFDHRHRFEECPKNMTFGPFDYMGKFEYIIKSVNNKPLDQYYCDSRTFCREIENDSMLYFIVDSPEKVGYVQFGKEGSIATFSDSSSNIIKAVNDSCVHRYDVVPFEETAKENGMPLLKIEEHHVHECGKSFFRNYYDVEKKKIVLRVQTREKVDDYRFINVRLFDYYGVVNMPVESYCDRELSQKDGYPVIRYVKLLEGDTLEVGRYEMENGEYVKKVSRAGDYDFAKTN